MNKADIKEIFVSSAIEHGNAMAVGNDIVANKMHKKLQNLYNKVKKHQQLNFFSELLDDEEESIRLWSATFSLTTFPIKAECVLKTLSESTSMTGTIAKGTLRLWQDGDLNLL